MDFLNSLEFLDRVLNGLVWIGMVWYGLIWYGLVSFGGGGRVCLGMY